VIESVKFYLSLASRDVVHGYLAVPRRTPVDYTTALNGAIDWICRAQDASGDGGVARSYTLAYHRSIKRSGWTPSYPETTGYIIPTMFDYARRTQRDDLFARAVRMTDWETDIQMPNGAVKGGTVDAPSTPAVFNTGQVLFGWVRAFEETRKQRYLDAAVRASDFLVSVQDPDGAWRKALGGFASSAIASYTYNTRTAWGLYLVGVATGSHVYKDSAMRNIDFALTEQQPNGWLRNNCLYDRERPLVHTIAYSLRGILEIGMAAREERYIAAARRGADQLLQKQREDGSLAGRYDAQWEPTVTYSCLTGNAQMGTVWARLFHLTGEAKYLEGLTRVNEYLRRVQWHGTGNPGLDGGISGSFPLHGRYNKFQVLNWAAKFFADSLMFEDDIKAQRLRQAV
jgi:uncharacterized protein YyaL (SSP411 family)